MHFWFFCVLFANSVEGTGQSHYLMQHHLNQSRFYLSDTCVHWPDTSCSRTTPTEHIVLRSGRKTHTFLLKEITNRDSPPAAHHMGGVSLRHVSAV